MHGPARIAAPEDGGYWAGRVLDTETVDAWAALFNRWGYLLIERVLPPETVEALRAELDAVIGDSGEGIALDVRMFESGPVNLSLFDLEPIVSVAERILGDGCHVIYNNSFRTMGGSAITGWHQDEAPVYLVREGEPPSTVELPALGFTCNYYLTDVTPEDGDGTQVVPGSHLFGAYPPEDLTGTRWEPLIETNPAPAGSVTFHNLHVWHRGGPNPGRPRYLTQVAYGRHLVGHRYHPYMNYQMPEHVYAGANERLRRLLGFLDHGPGSAEKRKKPSPVEL